MKRDKFPVVNFSLSGAECYVTDFIEIGNPRLKKIARNLNVKDVDDAIFKASRFVARRIRYPLDYRGRPTAAKQLKVFKWWNGLYLEDRHINYGWLTPSECEHLKYGICFDSSCLMTTLLRILGVEAYTVLGAVLETKTRKLLNYHAWTEAVKKDGEHVVIETTVHPNPAPPVPARKLYLGRMPIIYDPVAWFNEYSWRQDTEKARKYEALYNE